MAIDKKVTYFEEEGNQNLDAVLKVLKRSLRERGDLRTCKIIFFTAVGKGPLLAYSLLEEYGPTILAVTFPPNFSVTRDGNAFCPRISEKVKRFFDGVGIKVLSGRLPFDEIHGTRVHDQPADLIKKTLAIFNGSLAQCVQAVLQSCDMGYVSLGERVIAVSGDCAIVAKSSTTENFLTPNEGLIVEEFLCKPIALNVTRPQRVEVPSVSLASVPEATHATLESPIKAQLAKPRKKMLE